MIKKCILVVLMCSLCIGISACQSAKNELVDGYYTAEMSDYEHGWKEFVTICVSNGNIVTVEFNAKNSSGYIKAWDMDYMRNMNRAVGTYPNVYTRTYAAFLLNEQGAEKFDAVSGATHSGGNFWKMVSLLLEKAKSGDSALVVVPVES